MAHSAERLGHAACALIADALRDGHVVTIRAQGTSMLPAIWPSDRLTVRPLSAMVPVVGEVTLALWAGGLRAHRVIARSVDGVMTQGDALETPDPFDADTEVLGTVTHRNGKPLKNATFPRGVIGRLVTGYRPLQFIALKLIGLRRHLGDGRGLEQYGV